jgi:hypothetical protein
MHVFHFILNEIHDTLGILIKRYCDKFSHLFSFKFTKMSKKIKSNGIYVRFK